MYAKEGGDMKRYGLIVFIAVLSLTIGCKKKKKESKPTATKTEVAAKHPTTRKPAKPKPKAAPKRARPKPAKKPAARPSPARKPPTRRPPAPRRPVAKPAAQTPKRIVPDVRLLLTVADIEGLGLKPGQYDRSVLPGKVPGPDYDSLYYQPKNKGFGIAVQVWAFKNHRQAKSKYRSLFASLPNARAIDAISGDTLFAYWGDIIYVAFVHPRQKVVVNLSCSKKLCSSDKLYEIARSVSTHLDMLNH